MINICETFESIQGESSYAGKTCFFIRFSGCNLRCKYCDTTYAYEDGEDVEISVLVEKVRTCDSEIIEITGGEPLLQNGFKELAEVLKGSTDKKILVETNGSQDISVIPESVVAIIDVKCPGSGAGDSFDLGNIDRLRSEDELKFVLSDESDYQWAKDFVLEHDLSSRCSAVFFSPVWERLDKRQIEEWIIRDKLSVRVGGQLHKEMGVK